MNGQQADQRGVRVVDLAEVDLALQVAAVLAGGVGEHVLLVTLHHIVSDGWSMGILMRELGKLYDGKSL